MQPTFLLICQRLAIGSKAIPLSRTLLPDKKLKANNSWKLITFLFSRIQICRSSVCSRCVTSSRGKSWPLTTNNKPDRCLRKKFHRNRKIPKQSKSKKRNADVERRSVAKSSFKLKHICWFRIRILFHSAFLRRTFYLST